MRWLVLVVLLASARAQADAVGCEFGARWIRREVKRHHQQLLRCFTREVEYRGSPDVEPVLHFTIATTGRVTWSQTTGIRKSVAACLDAQVLRWQFAAGNDPVRVNYPLRMQLRARS